MIDRRVFGWWVLWRQVGFFIRLVPAEGVLDESCAKLDELGQPRFLVVSFTAEMSMVARMLWKLLSPKT